MDCLELDVGNRCLRDRREVHSVEERAEIVEQRRYKVMGRWNELGAGRRTRIVPAGIQFCRSRICPACAANQRPAAAIRSYIALIAWGANGSRVVAAHV